MNRLILILTFLLAALTGAAQIDVSGVVVEKGSKEPLTGASVILRNPEGKIRKFATSGADGRFSISTPEIKGYTLDVSMMSFAKQTVHLDSVQLPVTVVMQPAATVLKEVAIKADRIREQGDTITYNVGSFAQTQDRSIGDVLNRMPGIDVDKSGKIQYQGTDINKFYIEGSDLLGGKYGIATKGINHDDVGAVEVMENHQPMQVLSGISFSDKAAINLKLKNKAKATWNFHGSAGGGYSAQPEGAIWNGDIFAMAIMGGFQNITTVKSNNTGDNLSAQAMDFFTSGRGTDLHRYVGVSLPGVPNLSRKRTLFNRAVLLSTNSLWKLRNGEFKSQIDYSFSRVTASAANITTYFLSDGDRVITEDRRGTDRSHSAAGKFIYELNGKTAFINNTLKTNLNWDDIRLGVRGSLSNDQSVSLPDYYVSNDFKMIKRVKGKHLLTFRSVNEWESLPQTLTVSGADNSGNGLRQKIGDHAFYTHESATYALMVSGVTIGLEGGVKGYLRSMDSDAQLSGDDTSLPAEDFENVMNTNYLTVYVTPQIEYWVKRVNVTLSAPASFASYTFDKALANRSEVYFSPSLSVNWTPNNRLSLTLRGGSGRSPMNLNMIHPGFVMTDYRSFSRGIDDFYTSSSQNISARMAYKHTRKGLFANGMVMQTWSHLPYTMSQQLFGDYIVYSYSPARSDSRMLLASGNIGKTLDLIRGSANISGTFNRSTSQLISENSAVRSVSTAWSAGGKINGAPAHWLSIDYRLDFSMNRLAMNRVNESWLSNMSESLLFNFMPHRKLELQLSGEHYRNELTDDNFKNVLLLDAKAVLKPGKRIEVSASLSNILNRRTYNYRSYSELSSFESQRRLRGRELLITITLRK